LYSQAIPLQIKHTMKDPDVVVIGAGPAGSTAAAYLNRKGYRILVLEKERFPRFVIGESLLPNCMNFLDEAGLLQAIGKYDFQVKTGATFSKEDQRCNFYFNEQHSTESWSWTWQVKRKEFDQKLIEEAQRQGVEVHFETEVIDVKTTSKLQTISYKKSNGESGDVNCKFIIDASGYGRVIPRLFNLNKPSDLHARGSIYTHIVDTKRGEIENNNIFIQSFNSNESWFWIIPFSDETASVGIVSSNQNIEDYSKNDGEKFITFLHTHPGLTERFPLAKLLFKPQKIQGYSIGVEKMHGEGFVLCGNSTEFLDPVFSSGVTLAIGSALMAAKLVDRSLKNEAVNWTSEYDDVLKKGIAVFRSYVNGWYDGTLETIFFADQVDQKIKRQICSVLAGYVWDETNPFATKHQTVLKTLAKVISMQ